MTVLRLTQCTASLLKQQKRLCSHGEFGSAFHMLGLTDHLIARVGREIKSPSIYLDVFIGDKAQVNELAASVL